MKVISLKQPWATLVVMGVKKYETRAWNTFHRGKILIHASQAKDEAAMNLCLQEPFAKYIPGIKGFYSLPFGSIIGECKIDSTYQTEKVRQNLDEEELAFGDYKTGRMAWKLVAAVQYKRAVLCRGSLSLWDCPPEILNQIV